MRVKITAKTFCVEYESFVDTNRNILTEDFRTWHKKEMDKILASESFAKYLKEFDAFIQEELAKEKGWLVGNEGYKAFMKKPYFYGDADILQETFWDIVEDGNPNGHILIKLTVPLHVTLERDFEH